jgi:hypothetical protein
VFEYTDNGNGLHEQFGPAYIYLDIVGRHVNGSVGEYNAAGGMDGIGTECGIGLQYDGNVYDQSEPDGADGSGNAHVGNGELQYDICGDVYGYQ